MSGLVVELLVYFCVFGWVCWCCSCWLGFGVGYLIIFLWLSWLMLFTPLIYALCFASCCSVFVVVFLVACLLFVCVFMVTGLVF